MVEHNNHHLDEKTTYVEDENDQEAFEYNLHDDDEPPRLSCSSSRASASSSSPSHEFSFTLSSLYNSPSTTTTVGKNVYTASAAAIDLSPADEIFFQGHLLPLHILSSSGEHLPVSPRSISSPISLDSVITRFSHHSSHNHEKSSSMDDNQTAQEVSFENNNKKMDRPKSRSFSFFRNHPTTAKSSKSPEYQETTETISSSKPQLNEACSQNNHQQQKSFNNNNKTKFNLSIALKRYVKLVRPLLVFKQSNKRESGGTVRMRGQTFSHSSNHSTTPSSNKQRAEVVRGRFSAPASMRISSPKDSGIMLLEGSRSNNNSSSGSESTMEELQAAIQAAIAHCKNSSIAADQDKI